MNDSPKRLSRNQRSAPGRALVPANEQPPSLLEVLIREYEIADQFAKSVEQFREQASIPGINELRYAGYHLLQACKGDLNSKDNGDLIKAINHCRRATYEAGEAGIQTALEEISQFKRDYDHVVISDVVQNWHVILVYAQECISALKQNRTHGDDRSADYLRYKGMFEGLVPHCFALDAARDDLNNKIIQGRNEGRRFTVATCLAAFGIVVAIVIGLITLL